MPNSTRQFSGGTCKVYPNSNELTAQEQTVFIPHNQPGDGQWYLCAYRMIPGLTPKSPDGIEIAGIRKPIKYDPETGTITVPKELPKSAKGGPNKRLESMTPSQLSDYAVRAGFTEFDADTEGRTPEQKIAALQDFIDNKTKAA